MTNKYAEPKHSCPDIDDVRRALRSAADALAKALERECIEDLARSVDSAVDAMQDAAKDLEVVRRINEELREWGSAWRERAEEAEDQAASIERELLAAKEEATSR